MRAFARLLDRLAFTPARNGKLTLLRDYFAAVPDPERGWALASLTGVLSFNEAKPQFIRKAVEARMDPQRLAPRGPGAAGTLAGCAGCRWPLGAAEASHRRSQGRGLGPAGQAGAGG